MFSHLDRGSPARGMRSRTWRRSLGTGFQPRGEGHGLAGVKQVTLAKALRLTQPYVSDVARGRYRTITVENAWKFAAYFGCRIEDLFPLPRRPSD